MEAEHSQEKTRQRLTVPQRTWQDMPQRMWLLPDFVRSANLAYAIGVPQPVSIKIDTFGTEEIPKEIIEDTVNEVFDFSVAGIINSLSLTKVKYKPVAAYGHFGRTDLDLPWERLDKVNILQEKAVARMAEEICKNR